MIGYCCAHDVKFGVQVTQPTVLMWIEIRGKMPTSWSVKT